MAERSIADQELFLPPDNQTGGQQQPQPSTTSQPRYYENLNKSAVPDHVQSPEGVQNDQAGVPSFKVIPATPSTTRSSTLRSNMSQGTETKIMAGALPEVSEEDDLYGAPSTGPNHPSLPQQAHHEPYGATATPQVPSYPAPLPEPSSAGQHPSARYEHSYTTPHPNDPWAPAPYTGSGYDAPQPPPHPPVVPETHSTGDYGSTSGYQGPQPSALPTSAAPTYPPDHDPTGSYGASQPARHPPAVPDAHSADDYGSTSGYQVSQPPVVPTSASPIYPPGDHDPTGSYGAPQPPPHPPTYDEDQASQTGDKFEQPPALLGPRLPVPSKAQEEAPSSSVHPSVHLQSDQDYALALQLQDEEEGPPPPLPQRPGPSNAPDFERNVALSSHAMTPEEQDRAFAMRLQEEEDANAPALPIRHGQQSSSLAPDRPKAFTRTPSTDQFLPPPRREATDFGRDDPSDPIHYTRDPHKLIAYLVPFPTPQLTKAPSDAVPKRFLIYTPPPPPLQAPPEGAKEDKTHKVQRKWQDEVRRAKLSEAKTTSWAGFRAKLTRGVSKAMTYTTNSNVDFLSRVAPTASSPNSRSPSQGPKGEGDEMYEEDPAHQSHETKKTVDVEEMVFVYSPAMNLTPDAMRAEFINTVLRTKSKAMRDSVIATGLLPVSLAVDIVLVAVSGLFEVNAAWAYFNIKGAKTARSVGKRLSSSTATADTVDPEKPEAEMQKEDKLKLDFKPATRIDVLSRYLAAECHRVDPHYFPEYKAPPTESDCLEAIGWSPHQTGGQKNWEDEAWELNEVKDDLRIVMHKAAKEWRSYCSNFEKNPEKNLNK